MKKDNVNYFMVGCLVLSMSALLFSVLFYISGPSRSTSEYIAVYADIAGIKQGTAVTYGGYTIGEVSDIVPVKSGVKTVFQLQLSIDSLWQMPSDSVARIASPSLLSEKVVDIVQGENMEKLQPGQKIASQESGSFFQAFDDVAFELKDLSSKSIRPMLHQFSNSIQSVSQRLDSIGDELDGGVPELINKSDKLLGKMNDNADRLASLLSKDNRDRISSLLLNTDQASRQLRELSTALEGTVQKMDGVLAASHVEVKENGQELRQSMQDLKKTLHTISGAVDSIVYNLDTSSRNLNEFSRQIRMNPALLVGGKPQIDTAEVHR